MSTVSKLKWVLVMVMVFATASQARDYYGAISYSSSTGYYGYSYDYSSKWQAIRTARRKCGARDCVDALWFRNACGALALAGRGGYGTGWGTTRSRARREALRSCHRYNRSCYIQKVVCTR